MKTHEIYIGKATTYERKTEVCSVCGRPSTTYGSISDMIFFFCDDHEHLATEKNLIAEYERLLEE